MSALRVGILGCGGIAARHAQAVAALPDRMALTACHGRADDNAAAFARQHGGAPFTDFDAMLGAGIDLLIDALPPFARTGEAERAAARGVHLLVEKPLALDDAAADRLVAAAKGVKAANGFMYRHGEAVEAWQRADAGRVGLMTASFECNALHAPWWREQALSGGQIVEQAIHLIDLVRLFMGEPDCVYARRARLFHAEPGYDVEDVAGIVFGWDDGRIATVTSNNIAVSAEWRKGWALFAERMTGHFTGWNEAELRRADGAGPATRVAGTRDPFVAQLADLAEAIAEDRQPKVTLADGARTLRLALAARDAANLGREVRLTP